MLLITTIDDGTTFKIATTTIKVQIKFTLETQQAKKGREEIAIKLQIKSTELYFGIIMKSYARLNQCADVEKSVGNGTLKTSWKSSSWKTLNFVDFQRLFVTSVF